MQAWSSKSFDVFHRPSRLPNLPQSDGRAKGLTVLTHSDQSISRGVSDACEAGKQKAAVGGSRGSEFVERARRGHDQFRRGEVEPSVGLGMRYSFTSAEDAAPNGKDRSSDFNLDSARLYGASLNKVHQGHVQHRVGR